MSQIKNQYSKKEITLKHFYFIKDEIDFETFSKLSEKELTKVEAPYDHAIHTDFSKENDGSHYPGQTGALGHVGTAWYKTLLPLTEEDSEQKVQVYFGAVMSQSEIFVNGNKVGERPYGYISFYFSIEKYLKFDGNDALVVKVNNPENSSRWYPGAGLIRPVHLLISDKIHFNPWECKMVYSLEPLNPSIDSEIDKRYPPFTQAKANLKLSWKINNDYLESKKIFLHNEILDSSNRSILKWQSEEEIAGQDKKILTENKVLEKVDTWQVWDQEQGKAQIYRWVIRLSNDKEGKELLDYCELKTGFRDIKITANDGFRVNNTRINFKGVCLHHDQGPLGAVVNLASYRRQLRILMDMGVNAIRTTHNPFAEEFIQLCNELGLLVIAEAFDEWEKAKCSNGYNVHFKKWAERDLRDMIKRDRHSPSIIMWSIGNEILEQGSKDGARVSKYLADICRDEDSTREVTAGFNSPTQAIANGLVETIDVMGCNYAPYSYGKFKHQNPHLKIYGSETASTISSRGEYSLPYGSEKEIKKDNLQFNSWDIFTPGWGTKPDQEFAAQEENPFVMGEFIWTGFDYLGEPSPYTKEWPSRSSYFGAVDLCGLPKDRFYLYRSLWSKENTLHLSPHWNWEDCKEQYIPVQVYSNHHNVEVLVNGKSYGKKQFSSSSMDQRFRRTWTNIPWSAGELKAIAYNKEEKIVEEKIVYTAKNPEKIILSAEEKTILADGEDLCFIRFDITDAKENIYPFADQKITFTSNDFLEVVAVDNGDATSLTRFDQNKYKAFHGSGVVIIRGLKRGLGQVMAHHSDLQKAKIDIKVK